jgi:hypothetical protein
MSGEIMSFASVVSRKPDIDAHGFNNVNLEIYEYLLNDFPNDEKTLMKYVTTNIESSETEECEYIGVRHSYTNPNKNKIKVGERKRSCDVIKGVIDNVIDGRPQTLAVLKEVKNINTTNIDFELYGITSIDLINFTLNYPAKIESRSQVQIPYRSLELNEELKSMIKIYRKDFIDEIIKQLQLLLDEEWKTAICDHHKHILKNNNFNFSDIKKYTAGYKMIKIIKPRLHEQFIVIGDIHGSFATLVRILLRLRKKNILDEYCILNEGYNIVFLGDLVDRGIYGYEVVMILFLLKLRNPKNVFLNNGNHEDRFMNNKGGMSLLNQINSIFSSEISSKIFYNINEIFNYNHCAILIKNPIMENKYVYLAHGGLPTIIKDGSLIQNFSYNNFNDMSYYLVAIGPISIQNNYDSIRWNDWGNTDVSIGGNRGNANLYIHGKNILDEARARGIDMVIRGHQDSTFNTKLSLYDKAIPIDRRDPNLGLFDIHNEDLETNKICDEHIYLINQLTDGRMLINGNLRDKLMAVITLSTNTDYGRNLNRDSFAILKFTQSELPHCKNELEKNMRMKYLKYKNKYLKLKQQFEKK